MALGRTVGEGKALKVAHFEKKCACLAPPSGVMRQSTPSFRLIVIKRRTYSYGSKNQNSRSTGFCSMGDQSCKKKLENCTSQFLAENGLE